MSESDPTSQARQGHYEITMAVGQEDDIELPLSGERPPQPIMADNDDHHQGQEREVDDGEQSLVPTTTTTAENTVASVSYHPFTTKPMKTFSTQTSFPTDNGIKQPHQPKNVSIVWSGIRYEIAPGLGRRLLTRSRAKVVFQNLNGSLRAGEMTAIMGPSGAGKSCLLGALSCQRVNCVSGSIKVLGDQHLKMSVIPQNDPLLEEFTVSETLWYASRLKNSHFSPAAHEAIIQLVVGQLKLTDCLQNRVNKCSGGERRRLSIGCELVSSPDVLLLDEPSSGLDSSTAFQLVSLLRQLAVESHIIVTLSIHQPSFKVFNLFHKIYVLATGAGAIYEGSPQEMVARVEAVCPARLPQMTNPSDWIIDVASGEHGVKVIDALVGDHNGLPHAAGKESSSSGTTVTREESDSGLRRSLTDGANLKTLLEAEKKACAFPFWDHLYLLTRRAGIRVTRDPLLIALMLGTAFAVPLMFVSLFGKAGTPSGCPLALPDPLTLSFPQVSRMGDLKTSQLAESKKLFENYVLLLFVSLIVNFSSLMSAILSFPTEMQVARKEWHNSWFAVSTYFMGHTLAELPLVIISPAIFVAIVFPLTDQDIPLERIAFCVVNLVLLSMVSQSLGTFFGILFAHSPSSATYIATVSEVPFILLSGFFIQYEHLNAVFKFFSDISPFKYSFFGILVAVYGDRCECPHNPNDPIAISREGSDLESCRHPCSGPDSVVGPAAALGHDGTSHQNLNSRWIHFLADHYNLTMSTVTASVNGSGGGIQLLRTLITNAIMGGEVSIAMTGDCSTYRSQPMTHYGLDEDDIWQSLVALGVIYLVIKSVSYVVLYWRIRAPEV